VFSTGVLEVYKKDENGNPTGDCLLKIVIEGNQITEWKKG
jgi:hypothetical protein